MMSEAFLRMFVEAVGHYAEHIITQQDGRRVFQVLQDDLKNFTDLNDHC